MTKKIEDIKIYYRMIFYSLVLILTFFLILVLLIGYAGATVLTIVGILMFYFKHHWGK